MNLVRLGICLCIAFGLSTLRAASVYNYWQAVEGDYSGRWGDAAHWSQGHVPAADELATIDPTRGSPNTVATFVIEVDADYETDALVVGDPDNATRKISVTFTGSGKVTCAGTSSSIFRACTAITLDGPTFLLGGGNVLNYSPLTVKGGSRLWTNNYLTFWKSNERLTVEAGGTVDVNGLWFNEHDYGITVNADGKLVCRGQYRPYDGTDSASAAFGLKINGGDVQIATLKLTRPAAYVKMTSGSLYLANSPTLVSMDQLQLAGGKLRYGFDVLQDESDPYYVLAKGVDWIGCRVFRATNDVTFTCHDTFYASQLRIDDGSKPARIDCDRIVFDGLNWPFSFKNGYNRVMHLYGPTDLYVTGRNLNGFNNHYILCHGRVTVHTEDWNDAETKRNVSIRGLGSADGTLDLVATGGGTFTCGQVWSYETMRSCTIEEGTALVLGNRDVKFSSSTEWGPLATEKLTLEKDVTVAFTAGEQHIAASEWAIDPTVRFTVTIPATYTSEKIAFPAGAYPVLQDLDSKALPDSLLSQIVLAGETEGWSLVNENGQISVIKRDASLLGTFGEFEWLGGAGNANWSTVANWNGGTPAQHIAHVFGVSENRSVNFDNAGPAGGSTLGSIEFKDCAVRSFSITGNQVTFSASPTVKSSSHVPQLVAVGFRFTGGTRQLASYQGGPLVFAQCKRYWESKSGTVGHIQYVGDVRTSNNLCSNLGSLSPESNRTQFPSYRSCFTVLSGGNMTFSKQVYEAGVEGASLRVSKGGTLTYSAADGAHYGWVRKPASIVVNGTMNVGPIFRSGADQVYRGEGTLNISGGVTPYNASSRVRFGDTLTVNLATDWPTSVAGSEGLSLALGATVGTPVIRVPAGWTYGVPSGVTTTTTAEKRAFALESEAVAYIDPQGGAATIAEQVTGEGTLAITNGTMTLTASSVAPMTWLATCPDAALCISAAQTLGGLSLAAGTTASVAADVTLDRLSAAGARIDLGTSSTLRMTGDADLTEVTLVFNKTTGGWRTLVHATGVLTGTPVVDGFYRCRTIVEDGVSLFQVREPGSVILVR